jgi:site-specific DNA-methyltransferase (adenine-specific)
MGLPDDGVIAKVDRARQLLAEARDAGQAKQIADIARAAEVFARRQRLSEEAIEYATAVKIDARTMMGEFLKQAPKNQGANGSKVTGSKREPVKDQTPTLADAGISKRESSDAQLLATAKEESPKLYEEVRAGKKKVSHVRVEMKRKEKRTELEAKAEAVKASPADWRIVTGDCVEELRKLTDRPRLVFADPPYNIGIDYGGGEDADRLPADEFTEWLACWVRLCKSAITPDGSLWLLISDEFAAEACVALKKSFTLRNWVIWYETFGVNCADKFNRTKRHLFYCTNHPRDFVFHPDAVSRPSARQLIYNDGRAAAAGKLWDDVWVIPRLVGTAAERVPDFPTQLPLELLRPIVRCCSDPGDLVLDPFNGSGTTGVAALESGRRYLGVERSEAFAELARLRLKGVRRETGS